MISELSTKISIVSEMTVDKLPRLRIELGTIILEAHALTTKPRQRSSYVFVFTCLQ